MTELMQEELRRRRAPARPRPSGPAIATLRRQAAQRIAQRRERIGRLQPRIPFPLSKPLVRPRFPAVRPVQLGPVVGSYLGYYPGPAPPASTTGDRAYGAGPVSGTGGNGGGQPGAGDEGALAGASQFVASLQEDLATVLGVPVPVDGTWGAATRQAFNQFQLSRGLPVTASPAWSAIRMLRSEADRIRSGPLALEPDESTMDAPPDEPAEEPPVEQEFRIVKPGKIVLRRSDTTELSAARLGLPDKPGLYVITRGKHIPWYVGMSATSIRRRFDSRWKVLNDFGIDRSVLGGRFITCYTFAGDPVSAQGIEAQGTSKNRFKSKKDPTPLLLVLEQHYIQALGTLKALGGGNTAETRVTRSRNASLAVDVAGPPNAFDSKVRTVIDVPVQDPEIGKTGSMPCCTHAV